MVRGGGKTLGKRDKTTEAQMTRFLFTSHPTTNHFCPFQLNSNWAAIKELRFQSRMADELPLPRLAWNPAAESLSNAAARKRVRLSSPAVSSDPAIFSSDDDPSADNYTQERRKRKYRGPWYRQQPESEAGMQGMDDGEQPKKVKRLFERQFDSGVFMGSDGTDAEEQLEDREFASIASLPVRQSRGKLAELVPPTPEQLARAHIESCCESGTETIDLSSVIQTLPDP